MHKTAADLRVAPNFADYETARRGLSWDAIRRSLGTQPDGGLNIAWQAVDRHVESGAGDKVAFRFLSWGGPAARAVTYAELASLTNRFCNVLRELGVGKGETGSSFSLDASRSFIRPCSAA